MYYVVTAVNILKGFGFIQFEDEQDARKAVSMENGGLLKGTRLGKTFKNQPCYRFTALEYSRGILILKGNESM